MEQEVQNNEVPDNGPTVEDQAREQGWAPKEEFSGPEHKWVDAGEFLRRGELFDKIESQGKSNKAIAKELSEVREVLRQFKDHHTKVADTAYKKALEDLRTKKEEALESGDAKLLVAVDEQIAEVRERQRDATQQAQQQQVAVPQEEHPEFVAFKGRNDWYENDRALRRWADVLGHDLRAEGFSPSEVLREVEKQVRETFKHKFENPNRSKPGAVESSSGRVAKTNSGGNYSPSQEEQQVARKFVRQGLFKNEQEYYAELRAMKS